MISVVLFEDLKKQTALKLAGTGTDEDSTSAVFELPTVLESNCKRVEGWASW